MKAISRSLEKSPLNYQELLVEQSIAELKYILCSIESDLDGYIEGDIKHSKHVLQIWYIFNSNLEDDEISNPYIKSVR